MKTTTFFFLLLLSVLQLPKLYAQQSHPLEWYNTIHIRIGFQDEYRHEETNTSTGKVYYDSSYRRSASAGFYCGPHLKTYEFRLNNDSIVLRANIEMMRNFPGHVNAISFRLDMDSLLLKSLKAEDYSYYYSQHYGSSYDGFSATIQRIQLTNIDDTLTAVFTDSLEPYAINIQEGHTLCTDNNCSSKATYKLLRDSSYPICSLQFYHMDVPSTVTQAQQRATDKCTLYPNPATSNAMIEYHLAGEGNISLLVIDQLGRIQRTLVTGPQSSGLHRVPFQRNALPPGCYFLQLITKGNIVRYPFVISE